MKAKKDRKQRSLFNLKGIERRLYFKVEVTIRNRGFRKNYNFARTSRLIVIFLKSISCDYITISLQAFVHSFLSPGRIKSLNSVSIKSYLIQHTDSP